MARYQSVLNSMWDDPAFQKWSADAKLIFLNLITSPRQNPVGLYAVTQETLIFETKLTQDRFEAAFKEIQQPIDGYARVRYDFDKSVVWAVNTLKHQPAVHSKNRPLWKHVDAVIAQYERVCFIDEVVEACKGLGRGFKGAAKGSYKDKDNSKDKDLSIKGVVKGETPHQVVINRFLELQGTPRSVLTPIQVTKTYKRHSRSALALIDEAGGLENAVAALEWGAGYFDSKKLTWTLDTIARHLPTFAKYGRDDTLAAKHGLNRNQVEQFRKLASWLESKIEPSGDGEVVGAAHAGVSDHPT